MTTESWSAMILQFAFFCFTHKKFFSHHWPPDVPVNVKTMHTCVSNILLNVTSVCHLKSCTRSLIIWSKISKKETARNT